ncbi:cell surface A33 antigen [Spea bombifrons]|uniref:cell surface A33 antigen n=1 Tax=Spea bombifrons TaxID=233779 RepID=UPI00234BA568|nr:cell surface A33 antigen [Spea bombifrons]
MELPGRGLLVLVLGAALVSVSAINVQTPRKVIEAARGKSASLPCTYQTTATDKAGANVMWKRFPDQNEVISAFFGSINTTGSTYDGRVSFTGNVYVNDATVSIDQLTMDDNGTYQCEVNIPRDRQGTPMARLDLVVLVAPSKPDCGIVGTAEYGQVIKLTCSSKEGSPLPQYTWKSYTPQDVPRQLPVTAVIEGGELTLKNISVDSSGYFICTSTNKIGEDFCNLTLAVMPPSMNIGFYAGIIGGSVAGIIVIGIIVYCCCCRDRDDKEDYEMAYRDEDGEEEEEKPQAKKQPQAQQRNYHEEEYDDDDDEDAHQNNNAQRAGPPLPTGNKPRLVIDPVEA